MKGINEFLGQIQCALAFFHNSYFGIQMEGSMSGEAMLQVCSLLENCLLEFTSSKRVLDGVYKTVLLTIKMTFIKL